MQMLRQPTLRLATRAAVTTVLALAVSGNLLAGINILRNPSFELWHSDNSPAVWTFSNLLYSTIPDPAEAQFGNYKFPNLNN